MIFSGIAATRAALAANAGTNALFTTTSTSEAAESFFSKINLRESVTYFKTSFQLEQI